MTQNQTNTTDNITLLHSNDDVVQPFSLDETHIRGRIVRLGPVLEDIMSRHNYPAPVSYLLSETITLCVLLSAMLKYDGIFTLQIKGDGPIKALIADTTADGKVRAYASFDEAAVKTLTKRKQSEEDGFFHLLGKGYVAFTVDQERDDIERYQGIVELRGESLVESVQYYFEQSEQIKTSFKFEMNPQDGQWRSGAIMLQHVPAEGGESVSDVSMLNDEDWARSEILMQSCKLEELLSPVLSLTDVLYRLFHEEAVRAYPSLPIKHVCRCSLEKIQNVILSLPESEVTDIIAENGAVKVDCEFCSRHYVLTAEDIADLKS